MLEKTKLKKVHLAPLLIIPFSATDIYSTGSNKTSPNIVSLLFYDYHISCVSITVIQKTISSYPFTVALNYFEVFIKFQLQYKIVLLHK